MIWVLFWVGLGGAALTQSKDVSHEHTMPIAFVVLMRRLSLSLTLNGMR